MRSLMLLAIFLFLAAAQGCFYITKNQILRAEEKLKNISEPQFDLYRGKSEKWVRLNFGNPANVRIVTKDDLDNELTRSLIVYAENTLIKELYYHFGEGEYLFWFAYEMANKKWYVISDAEIPNGWEF